MVFLAISTETEISLSPTFIPRPSSFNAMAKWFIHMLKRVGDKLSPCLTPCSVTEIIKNKFMFAEDLVLLYKALLILYILHSVDNMYRLTYVYNTV